jgi:hypothetical protein
MAISKPAYYCDGTEATPNEPHEWSPSGCILRKGDFNLVLCLDETLRTVVDPPQAERHGTVRSA